MKMVVCPTQRLCGVTVHSILKLCNQDEADSLQECLGEDGEIWDYEDYEEIEMDSCFDGCSEDFVHYGNHFTEAEQEALAEEYEEQLDSDEWMGRYEWLEERGFESLGCNWQIHGGIEEESETEVYVQRIIRRLCWSYVCWQDK